MAMAAPENAGQLQSTIDANRRAGIPAIGAKPKDSAVTGQARSFRETEFRQKESTGARVGERGEKRRGIEGRDVTFSAELTTQYEHFLYDHLEGLLRVTNPAMLDNDAHRHELRLREALCTDNRPDKNKITEYLRSSDGWAITTQLIEDQTAEKIFGAALHAATRPRGERIDQLDENTIRLRLDQGLLNRVMMDHVWPWLDERVNVTAGRPEERGIAGQLRDLRRWQSILSQAVGSIGLGATTAILTGGNIPASLAVSAVVPGLFAIRNTLNSGVTIDLRQCSAALQSIQNDANEAAYLRSVLNIDVTNFRVAGVNQIELRDAHALSPNDMNQIQKEIFQGLYAREQFYTSLGVPYEQLDALPEQHLYLYYRGQAEQTGTHWQKRLNEIFQPQTAGILDTAGRPPNNPNFLTGGATLDFEGNLRRFRVARRQVMMEMMTDQITRVEDKSLAEGAVTTINGKITARTGEQGTERQARIKTMSERKNALTKEQDNLASDKTILNEYTAARTALDTEQKNYEREFENAFLAGRSIDDEYARVNNLLVNQADPASVPARRAVMRGNLNAAIIAAYAQVDLDLNAAYGANPVPNDVRTAAHADARQRTTELFQADLDALAQEATELTTQRTRLVQIRDAVRNARRTLNEKADRTVSTAKENLATIQADHATLGGWGVGDVMLRTMIVDELMVQINAAWVANNANGWPEAQNNLPANRQRVINAIAEAKAAFEESFDTQKPVRDPDYNAITGWGAPPIMADQLRTMSRQQLLVLINQANVANGAHGWPAVENANPANLARLGRAVEEARNRMILRHNAALTARLADLDAQINTEQSRIDAINFESEIDVLNTVKDLMGRQPKIFEMAYDVASDRARYTDVNPVDATDPTFTTAEKAAFEGAVPPVGYWRIMNALFAYETKTDRSTYVGKMLRTLPPNKLARYINSSLGILALGDPGFEDITVALTNLENGIATNNITGIDVRGVFRDIINGLRAEANAI